MRHPVTGRFMAGDYEIDCIEHCAGPCGVGDLVAIRCLSCGQEWPRTPEGVRAYLAHEEGE